MGVQKNKRRRENALLDVMQEPPVRDVPYAGEDVHEFAPTDQRHPEERSAGDDLGVIQIPLRMVSSRTPRREGVWNIPVYARIIE
jgi:hypothetical protein